MIDALPKWRTGGWIGINPAPTWTDFLELIENMRKADRRELELATGSDCFKGLEAAMATSRRVIAVRAHDKLCCIYGVQDSPLMPNIGIAWMLATPEIEKYPIWILRAGKNAVDQWLNHYTVLTNYVWAENHKSVRWLEHLGFAVGPPKPYGPKEALFRRFTKERGVLCAGRRQ